MDNFFDFLNCKTTNKRSTTRIVYFVSLILAIMVSLTTLAVMVIYADKGIDVQIDYSKLIWAAAGLILCAGVPKISTDIFSTKIKK